MKIFVVIPLYNEEKHIAEVIRNVSKFNLPVVVVDDGSSDGSLKKLKNLKTKKITILCHKINLGKGAAMKTGAEFAFANGAESVIFMDSDSQHDAEDLKAFISVLNEEKYEMVFGSRNMSYGVPLVRFLGNKIASVIMSIFFGNYVSDVLCGFRALTKKGYEHVKWESVGYGVEVEMIARVGKNHISFCEIPVKTIYKDKVKGVTILDAFGILLQVLKWRLTL